jgi:hypothetical protein
MVIKPKQHYNISISILEYNMQHYLYSLTKSTFSNFYIMLFMYYLYIYYIQDIYLKYNIYSLYCVLTNYGKVKKLQSNIRNPLCSACTYYTLNFQRF